MSDLFKADPATTNTSDKDVNYLEVMTAKFKTAEGQLDPVALAKGKYEADNHITRVESELADLRKELAARLSFEKAVDLLNRTPTTPQAPTPPVTTPDANAQGSTQLDSTKLEEMIESRLNQRSQEQVQERNVALVRQELTNLYGANFQSKLSEVTNALNVSEDYIRDMARTAPQALIKLVSAAVPVTQHQQVVIPPRSSTTVAAGHNNQIQNESYWNAMKARDKNLYFSREQTMLRHNAAQRLGDAYKS